MFFGTKELTIYDAHEYYLDGKYEKALDLCEKILAMYPDRYSALNLIANIYFINGNFEKGEQYLYKLKDHFFKKKEYAKAVAVIKRLLAMRPDKVKYYHHIADIYEEAGDKKGFYRSSLKAADILRKSGHFKDASNVYLGMGAHFKRPEFLISLLNKIIALGEAEKACELAKRYILPSDRFTLDEKDDVILLCAESGCSCGNFIDVVPEFLSRGEGRINIIEDALVRYFTENKNDELFLRIASVADTASLVEKLGDAAPENLPSEQVNSATEEISEPEPTAEMIIETAEEADTKAYVPETFEIETHTVVSEDVDVAPLELDEYENDGELHVSSDISGLDTFEQSDEPLTITALEGLESHLIDDKPQNISEDEMSAFDDAEAVYPEADGLDLFDEYAKPESGNDIFADFGGAEEGADIFSAFDAPATAVTDAMFEEEPQVIKEPVKEVEQIDMSDVEIIQSEQKDIFADIEETEAEEEKLVQKLDMSDVKIEKNDDDMFAGLVEEKTEEPEKKETVKIDMSDIKTEKKDEMDIFEREV
jgi:tetratricopeptide (TPR) repeat protein